MVISIDNKKSAILKKFPKKQIRAKRYDVLFPEIITAVDLSHHHQQYLPPESTIPDDVSDISHGMEDDW